MVKKLRELRKSKGMTMKELGELVGVAESTISQYETGKREPDYETLLKFTEIFDVSVDFLLRGDVYNGEIIPLEKSFMTTVDRVKSICKERKIPISKLEKDLGFSNGYIGQLRKGTLPDDRLTKIAAYLGVDIDKLTGKQEKNVTDEDIMFALFNGSKNITPEMFEEVKSFAKFVEERENERNRNKTNGGGKG